MVPPTPQMAEILAVIERLTADGVPPSWSEIGREINLAPSNVHGILLRMKERGLVDWSPRRARSLRVIDPAVDYSALPTETLLRIHRRVAAVLANRSAA